MKVDCGLTCLQMGKNGSYNMAIMAVSPNVRATLDKLVSILIRQNQLVIEPPMTLYFQLFDDFNFGNLRASPSTYLAEMGTVKDYIRRFHNKFATDQGAFLTALNSTFPLQDYALYFQSQMYRTFGFCTFKYTNRQITGLNWLPPGVMEHQVSQQQAFQTSNGRPVLMDPYVYKLKFESGIRLGELHEVDVDLNCCLKPFKHMDDKGAVKKVKDKESIVKVEDTVGQWKYFKETPKPVPGSVRIVPVEYISSVLKEYKSGCVYSWFAPFPMLESVVLAFTDDQTREARSESIGHQFANVVMFGNTVTSVVARVKLQYGISMEYHPEFIHFIQRQSENCSAFTRFYPYKDLMMASDVVVRHRMTYNTVLSKPENKDEDTVSMKRADSVMTDFLDKYATTNAPIMVEPDQIRDFFLSVDLPDRGDGDKVPKKKKKKFVNKFSDLSNNNNDDDDDVKRKG